MPIIIYGGFGRLIIVSERKKTFMFATHSQEVFMHTVPLGVLTYYNNVGMVSLASLNIFAVLLPMTSLALTFSEVAVL